MCTCICVHAYTHIYTCIHTYRKMYISHTHCRHNKGKLTRLSNAFIPAYPAEQGWVKCSNTLLVSLPESSTPDVFFSWRRCVMVIQGGTYLYTHTYMYTCVHPHMRMYVDRYTLVSIEINGQSSFRKEHCFWRAHLHQRPANVGNHEWPYRIVNATRRTHTRAPTNSHARTRTHTPVCTPPFRMNLRRSHCRHPGSCFFGYRRHNETCVRFWNNNAHTHIHKNNARIKIQSNNARSHIQTQKGLTVRVCVSVHACVNNYIYMCVYMYLCTHIYICVYI